LLADGNTRTGVGDARHQLLSRALSDHNYQDRKKTRAKLAMIGHLLRANATDVPLAALLDVTRAREDQKIALIMAQEVQQLSAMDRYERRARSRRKSAVRAFDLAKRNLCIKGTRDGV
jgi:hypothetical protein